MQLQELKTKAEEALNKLKQEALEAAEANKYNAIISGTLGKVIAARAVGEHALKVLKDIEMSAIAIVENTPIMNKATREMREFKPSRIYGYGTHIEVLTGILSGIQYSAIQHKMLILAEHPTLTESLISDTLEAFGSPAFFSEKYCTVVEERPFDYAKARELVEIIALNLGITLDLSSFSEQAMTRVFEAAKLKAETLAAEYKTGETIKTVDAAPATSGTIQVEG